MKITHSGRITEVTLSKRNLETLLNKLTSEESARTLFTVRDGHMLLVKAEPDEEHYKGREPGKVLQFPEKKVA